MMQSINWFNVLLGPCISFIGDLTMGKIKKNES
jgi:hypothetical protein